MSKLTVGYITDLKDVEWLKLSIESSEPIADEVLIIEDGHHPENLEILDKFIDGREKFKIIHSKYAGNNGAQYNQILKNAMGDWILVLDSDEILDDSSHLILEHIREEKYKCFFIRMEHAIYDFAHFDATLGGGPQVDPNYIHHVPFRLFKVKPGLFYPNTEHGTLTGYQMGEVGVIDDVSIWHYGKAKAMLELRDKFKMNLERSKAHAPGFLWWWYSTNLLGKYPVKELTDISVHPSVIKREFFIDEIKNNIIVREDKK